MGSHGGMHMMTAAGNYASMPPGSPEQSNSTSPGIGGGGGGPSGNPGNLSRGIDNKIVKVITELERWSSLIATHFLAHFQI